jgi:hypothetical protein
MADQVGEQVKDLGSDWNQAGAALELAPVGIEHEIFEQIAQLDDFPRGILAPAESSLV